MFMKSTKLHDGTQSKCTPSVQLNPTNASAPSIKPVPGFRKVCSTGEAMPCPIPGLSSNVLEMRVKEGSKIRNLLNFAFSRFEGDLGLPPVSQVLFSGTGRALTKTITCAEIMKRRVQGLHQVTKLQYRTVNELWENQESSPLQMTIHRTLPSICILLSKDPLDPLEPGYQAPAEAHPLPGENSCLVAQEESGKPGKRASSSCDFHSFKRAALGQD